MWWRCWGLLKGGPKELTTDLKPPPTEPANVLLSQAKVGKWVYLAKGVGLQPTEPRKVSVVSQVHRATSSTLTFKNPFLQNIQAMVILETSSERGVFNLLQKKSKLTIAPLGMAQIPFSFCPASMSAVLALRQVRTA